MDKSALREKMNTMLKVIEDKIERSNSLVDQFTPILQKERTIQIISFFISLPDEVHTDPLALFCRELGFTVTVPEYHQYRHGDSIDFREWKADAELITVKSGLSHPRDGQLYELEDIDLIFVPGLAFTKDGKRLGRGGGFYDRLLQQFKGSSIGLCFEEQLIDDLPMEEHDQKVDRVVWC